MACRVVIDSVVVTPLHAGEHTLQEITVVGHAEECGRILVTLACDESVSYSVDVDENGSWSGRFDVKAAECECGEQSVLVASCADHSECESDTRTFTQRCPPTPGPCPAILNIIPAVSSTCAAGRRSVTFTADVRVGNNPAQASDVHVYRWEFGDPSPAVLRSGSQGSGPVTHAYTVATDQTVLVTLTVMGTGEDASGITCLDTFAVSVTVPACGCPAVTGIAAEPDDCSADGTHRTVSLRADITGQADEFVWSFGDGQTATVAASAGGNRRAHAYAAPGTYTVRVTARAAGCTDSQAETTFTVAACERPSRDHGGGRPGREEQPRAEPQRPVDDTSQRGFDICSVLMFLILLGAGLFVIGVFLAMCPAFFGYSSDPRVIYAIAAGLAIIGAFMFVVALVLWWILCRPSFCDWVALAWKVFFIAGMTALYYLFCTPCAPLALLGAGMLLGAALLTWLYWVLKCNPNACTIFNELVVVMVALDIVTLLEVVLGGCVLTSNWWGAIFWVVLIAALNVIAVTGQQRFCRLPRGGR